MKLYLHFFLIIIATPLSGQVLIDAQRHKQKIYELEATPAMPENLLSAKAIVIHAYDNAPEAYKKNAAQLQPGFSNAGIDVVAHYLFEDVFSGTEAVSAYKSQISAREIDFIIYYTIDSAHRLFVMSFNGEIFFNERAYIFEKATLKELLDDLYLQTARSKQKKHNFLILKSPAFGETPKVIQGRRAEFYDLNMKSGKVAIPKTPDSLINRSIDSLMATHYPYGYGLVDPGLTDAELRRDGFWFVLYGVHGSGRTVKKLLEYPASPQETAYASIVADGKETDVKTIGVNRPVYKFYIKHVQSSDVFLGKHYDADENWEVALKNYIRNLRNILDR